MMPKWAILGAVAAAVVVLGAAAGVTRAGDDEDKPLQKLMKKIDAGTKSIREATTTVAKFKKAGNGKDIARTASEIARLGKETRGFKEPSEQMKKPYDKWLDMNDRFVAAADEVAHAAGKGDLIGTRKAWAALNNACTNCHGAFRPEVGDGF
jgi:cytochrome c556